MRIYAFFLCFNYISVNAREIIISVPHTMNRLNAEQIARQYKPSKGQPYDKDLGRFLDEYMGPLNVLKERFPNHQLEFQVEIEREHDKKVVPRLNRRMAISRRSGNEGVSPLVNPSPTTTKAPATTSSPSDKKPIYAEDLQKAMEALLKKLSTNLGPAYSVKAQYHERLRQATKKSPINIAPIIDLLGKGVQIQHHIPQPRDGNLNWIQIKVPKP